MSCIDLVAAGPPARVEPVGLPGGITIRTHMGSSFYKRREKSFRSCVRGSPHKSSCFKQVRLTRLCRALAKLVREAVAADFVALCIDQARSLQEAALEGCTKRMFEFLRQIKPWAPKRQLRLIDTGGLPAAPDYCERCIVRRSFSAKLGAVDDTSESFIMDDRDTIAERSPVLHRVVRSIDAVPTVTFLVGKHAKAKMNGLGEQCIGGELDRFLPRTTAFLAHPLNCKAAMCIRLPVQWLGGCLMELFKGMGRTSFIRNFRDITLSDLSSKDFGSFVRIAVFLAVTTLGGDAQYGAGLNADTTCMCHLHVTQAFAMARTRKISCGVLFIDIVAAFVSVARRVVIPDMPTSEEQWRIHITHCGFNADDADDIVSQALTVLKVRRVRRSMRWPLFAKRIGNRGSRQTGSATFARSSLVPVRVLASPTLSSSLPLVA